MHKKRTCVCGIKQIPLLFSHKESQEISHVIYLGCSNNSFSHLFLNLQYNSHLQHKNKKHFEFSLLTLSSEDFVFKSINMHAALERCTKHNICYGRLC